MHILKVLGSWPDYIFVLHTDFKFVNANYTV